MLDIIIKMYLLGMVFSILFTILKNVFDKGYHDMVHIQTGVFLLKKFIRGERINKPTKVWFVVWSISTFFISIVFSFLSWFYVYLILCEITNKSFWKRKSIIGDNLKELKKEIKKEERKEPFLESFHGDNDGDIV